MHAVSSMSVSRLVCDQGRYTQIELRVIYTPDLKLKGSQAFQLHACWLELVLLIQQDAGHLATQHDINSTQLQCCCRANTLSSSLGPPGEPTVIGRKRQTNNKTKILELKYLNEFGYLLWQVQDFLESHLNQLGKEVASLQHGVQVKIHFWASLSMFGQQCFVQKL